VKAEPARRALLVAAAALPLAAAGCRSIGALATPPAVAPGVRVLARAIAGEQWLVHRYQAVISGVAGRDGPRDLAGSLGPILAEHRAHLARLRARLIVPAGSAVRLAGPVPAAGAVVPASPAAAIAALRAGELRASVDLLGALAGAPPSLAQLLASISASEASHVPALDRMGRAA
jgi:hypothetical protein